MHPTDYMFFATLPLAVLGLRYLWDQFGRWLDEQGL